MRRVVMFSLAVVMALPATLARSQGQPPHAWLFGTWTGGLFPVASRLSPDACFSQPVVIFTRDLVLRATLTQQILVEREIVTARATAAGADFRFVGTPAAPQMFGATAAQQGFGCASADMLTVQREGENQITFPGCTDFPYPLVRCQTH